MGRNQPAMGSENKKKNVEVSDREIKKMTRASFPFSI